MQNRNDMAAEYNDMQKVKRAFFTMRNGALADNMRRQGASYRIIFGVNLPQLAEIAKATPHDAVLAQLLWDNKTTRESQLLAPMIYPREEFAIATARCWVAEIPTAEVADILCHRLLRYVDYADAFAQELIKSENDMEKYAALRLMFNRLPNNIDNAELEARTEQQRGCALTASLCRALIDEIEFLREQ